MRRRKSGFTLVELLVVIAIIGILSAIGLVSLNGAREKARDAQRKSDVGSFRSALALYFDDYNAYPAGPSTITNGTGTITPVGGSLGLLNTLSSNYIPTWPNPPKGTVTAHGVYAYVTNAGGSGVLANTHFMLYSTLERPITSGTVYQVTDASAQEGTAITCGATICP